MRGEDRTTMMRKMIIVFLVGMAAATTVTCVASSYRPLLKRLPWGESGVTLSLNSGSLTVTILTQAPRIIPAQGVLMPRTLTRLADDVRHRSPFILPSLEQQSFPGGKGGWTNLVLPLWIPLLVFSFYPVLAVVGVPLRRWRRRKRGLCVRCRYNLTGNESGVCPECGTEIEQS